MNQPDDPELVRFLRDELGAGIGDGAGPGGSWTVNAPLWRWQGAGKDGQPSATSWFFITIDGAAADGIRASATGRTAAWGSVYVTATIGATQWRTSLFPSKNVKGYLLPVKAAVRKAEKIAEGDVVAASVSLG